MTPTERRDARTIVALLLVVVLGFFIGSFIPRPSGIYPDRRSPVTEQRTPDPRMKSSGAETSTAYVERSNDCRNPGGTNQAGYCWYEGWAFTRKTVCIDSSIPGAPLVTIAKQFTGPGGIATVVGGTKVGACAAKGYPASQRVSFLSMSKATAARYGYGVCGLTSAANYGNLSSINVAIYLTGPQSTPCGAGTEWVDVWAHELGHTFGLSHNQPYASSIMRDGHWPDRSDRAKLVQIYGGRRA